MRMLLLPALLLTLTACSHAKVKPSAIQPGCMKTPPPPMEVVAFSPCPPDLAICLDLNAAKALRNNVRGMSNWIQEAWLRCGPR